MDKLKFEIEPSAEQLKVVEMVKNNKISILTGGPGTGKTFTTQLVLKWALDNKLTIKQAAPTGKAAKRMEEVTGYIATTIHALLECIVVDGFFEFVHNADNKLSVDLLILDEVSMVDINLMNSVVNAIDLNRTRVLLVGDQDQLPSIGPGSVLSDLLKSKFIPHVELTKTFRNCGEIVKVCHKIKRGRSYSPAKKFDLESNDPVNLIHIEIGTPEKTKATVIDLATKIMPHKGFDPINDIQIISPVNESGVLSCKSINETIRDILNPIPTNITYDDDNIWSYRFRKGDRVINTKNMKVTTIQGKVEVIVNGDLGIVQYVGKKTITVSFSDSSGTGRWVSIDRADENLLHAYAITCHRFQGSESPVVIIPVHFQFNPFLTRSWIYTALSRGRSAVITVGLFNTIQKAIGNKTSTVRFTKLVESIHEMGDECFGEL